MMFVAAECSASCSSVLSKPWIDQLGPTLSVLFMLLVMLLVVLLMAMLVVHFIALMVFLQQIVSEQST